MCADWLTIFRAPLQTSLHWPFTMAWEFSPSFSSCSNWEPNAKVSKAREVCISMYPSRETENTLMISTEGDLGQRIGYQSVRKPRGEKRRRWWVMAGTTIIIRAGWTEKKVTLSWANRPCMAEQKCRTPDASWRLCWSFRLVAFTALLKLLTGCFRY